jgi:hypothetical protein
MAPRYCIGIDLGTTNSVLAFASLDESEAMIGVLPIPQVTAPGSVEARLSLPSFWYLPQAMDSSFLVPGFRGQQGVVGEYARNIAAEQPERVVIAAKSWLCHAGIDRQSPILPWQSDADLDLVSPVAASAAILEHLIDAWTARFPNDPFSEQQVVLTVPASFDAAARELTRKAALSVGFPESFLFLEEPQAALYNWVHAHGKHWRRDLQLGDVLLVVDVGGGTTDLTLVRVESEGGDLVLHRLAVGNHLLVGGDNMDLALAHVASELFADKGGKLNPWQAMSLWHACRAAKETLLGSSGPETHPLTVLGRGSRLIGGTITATLERQAVEEVLVDGFFPRASRESRPRESSTSGFHEFGLPFASDTAITRHLAAFLQDNVESEGNANAGIENGTHRITHLLLNGGVFNATVFRDRLLEVLASWQPGKPTPILLGGIEDLDQAVACGAAYYGWARLHGGVRIRGGTARSYYIGIETAGPSVPGLPRPLQALCVVAQGTEEGTEHDVSSRPIGLKVGQRSRFRFFSSNVRQGDRPGTVLKSWDEHELQETSPLEVQFSAEGSDPIIPVRFHSRITELGVFELYCRSTTSNEHWKLELNVRE